MERNMKRRFLKSYARQLSIVIPCSHSLSYIPWAEARNDPYLVTLDYDVVDRDWFWCWDMCSQHSSKRIPRGLQVSCAVCADNIVIIIFSNYNRFVIAVFPSAEDDVITSPYNWLVIHESLPV